MFFTWAIPAVKAKGLKRLKIHPRDEGSCLYNTVNPRRPQNVVKRNPTKPVRTGFFINTLRRKANAIWRKKEECQLVFFSPLGIISINQLLPLSTNSLKTYRKHDFKLVTMPYQHPEETSFVTYLRREAGKEIRVVHSPRTGHIGQRVWRSPGSQQSLQFCSVLWSEP